MPSIVRALVVYASMLLLTPASASATWSIVLADSHTKEVAIATVTCIPNFDLGAVVPVVVVGRGAAAVQAFGDFDGIRRPVIFEGLINEADPADIMAKLEDINGHQQRQYGIADTLGRTVTFTGTQVVVALPWAAGATGQQGSLFYAVQGNVLTGPCVRDDIITALVETAGDIPAKLMAGAQAARAAGGDGRCSCEVQPATACGCPPDSFTHAGFAGTMVIARIGDADDPVCNAAGCADGQYFLRLNVSSNIDGPDPVDVMQQQFDAWRASLTGCPDAIQSTASFNPPLLPANGVATTTMTINLRDWQQQSIDDAGIRSVTVGHAPDSAGLSTIGPVVDEGQGVYSVAITAPSSLGIDRFRVVADDGMRPVTLMPDPTFAYVATGDSDGDADVDLADYQAFRACETGPGGQALPTCHVFDFDDDGDVDLTDACAMQLAFD